MAAQVSSTVKAALDAGYLAQSDSRAQALARQPIVVGFAGSEQQTTGPSAGDASSTKTINARVGKGFFGWLFGPEYSVKDSKTLGLQHGVRSYGVNADVSFPGWWSYITLDISTAWIENWQSANVIAPFSEAKKNLSMVRKRVELPISDATYESLTNFIAAQQYGPQNSRIFASVVTPTLVPACTSSVTFQINGTNIWRADSIFLGGVKAKTISVLPDMNGVAAEFDMNAVYGTLVSTDSSIVQAIPLMVSAEQGSADPLFIWVVGNRHTANGVTNCQSPILLPTNVESMPFTVVSFSPKEICSDLTKMPLVVQGINMPIAVKVHSGQFDEENNNWNGDWLHREVDLKLKAGVKLTPGPLTIALTYKDIGNFAGSVSLNFTVKDCLVDAKIAAQDKPPANPPAKTPPKAAQ